MNATPISCGQLVTGSVGTSTDPPPWRVYTFTGAVNDVLTIRTGNLTGGNFVPNIELYSPTGSLLVNTYTGQVDRTLTAAGTYTILMRDYANANAGNFALTWQKMNAPCNLTPINCGQVLSGSILAGELDVYSFTVSANDVVTIRVRKTSGTFSPYMELFNAAGSRIAGPSTQIDTTFAAAGTYTILVRDYYTKGTGNYLIYWQTVKNPCNVVADLNCGQAVTGSIGTSTDPPPWRVYTFTGAVNDVLTIRAGNLTGGNFIPNIELYSPTGSLLVNTYTGQVDRTLTAAGTYTILIRDYANANAGNFALTWQKMNNPCNTTATGCGQAISGSITTAGQMIAYTFIGAVNDVMTIRMLKTSGNLSPYMELFNPSGVRVGNPSNTINATLTVAGGYTILVRDQNYLNTGGYILIWERFNNPCAPVINGGQSAAGAIGLTPDAPPWGFYSFTVSANDIVTIRAIKTSGTLVPYLELYNATGGLVTSAAGQINQTMAAGTYILLLRDQSYTNTGGYAVTWQRWNNPGAQAAGCGQVMAGSIGTTASPPPWQYYSFTASANDSVTIRASKTSGTLTPYIELYSSTGSQVGTAAGQLDKTLLASDTYTVVVRDQNNINTGDYVFTWLRVNTPCNATPIGCGQLLSSSLNTIGKIDGYTILANSGDNIVLTLTKTSGGLDPSLELYNSSGTRVAYQYTPSGNQVSITQTLSAAGTYTVLVSDYGNDETGSYTLKFQKNNNFCSEVTVATPNGGEVIVETSTFTIRWTCTNPQNINSQEIRLSTDGGQSFPNVIITGLQGDARTYNWVVPPGVDTDNGRIRVIITDASSNSSYDDSDADFTIYQPVGRAYVYDELNRLIQIIYEDGRRVTYTYDASGNRITLTNE